MFTQFFGGFLLNEGLVTSGQLSQALEDKKNTRLKLGVLAINAGLMTAEQVEQVHERQATVDMRIGDLAVDMGFLTSEQVETLLDSQLADYLTLGQALINNNVLTNAQFEKAINDYKATNSLSEDDIYAEQSEKVKELITKFYNFGEAGSVSHTAYIVLLFKNLIRFIGDDFTPLEAKIVKETKVNQMVFQTISGTIACETSIEAEDEPYIKFASRFAGEELSEIDEMALASVGEFLNLHNGLFTVNISNDFGIELNLNPQNYIMNKSIRYTNQAFCIPLAYSFGTVNFYISI